MKKRIIILTIFLYPLFSCASQQISTEAPFFKPHELILSKSIDRTETSVNILGITNKFSVTDPIAIASIKIEGVTGTHELRWEWLDPKGEIYLLSENHLIRTNEGKYRKVMTAWHRMGIKESRAAGIPGTWQVGVYLDGNMISTKTFTIE